ncbi:MAG TPA: DUF4383 domain-containing protein [Solirubrobacteraceae bacterium]|nr:DUF4383 domain-containing protein [Solirubrobacteraceae bacterium]
MSATYAPATATERRVSLSRGPALIVGTILLAAGLYFMYRQHTYPRWSNFPNGGAPVDRHVLGIFGINGFTGLLTAICGGLLLFGAAQHYLAKTMSLIVGIVLGAAAIIGAVSGNVLGLAASNGWTELAWGIAAAILLINAVIPARRRVYERPGAGAVGAAGAGAVAGAAAGDVAARRRTRRTAGAEDPAYAGTGPATTTGTAAGAGTAAGPGTAAGAGTGAAGQTAPAAGQTAPAAGETPAREGRDVNYSHRITGGSGANQPANGEPVAVGGGNSPAEEEQTAGTGNGGALSRLFGRRS